jgi:hypothetical protein
LRDLRAIHLAPTRTHASEDWIGRHEFAHHHDPIQVDKWTRRSLNRDNNGFDN